MVSSKTEGNVYDTGRGSRSFKQINNTVPIIKISNSSHPILSLQVIISAPDPAPAHAPNTHPRSHPPTPPDTPCLQVPQPQPASATHSYARTSPSDDLAVPHMPRVPAVRVRMQARLELCAAVRVGTR